MANQHTKYRNDVAGSIRAILRQDSEFKIDRVTLEMQVLDAVGHPPSHGGTFQSVFDKVFTEMLADGRVGIKQGLYFASKLEWETPVITAVVKHEPKPEVTAEPDISGFTAEMNAAEPATVDAIEIFNLLSDLPDGWVVELRKIFIHPDGTEYHDIESALARVESDKFKEKIESCVSAYVSERSYEVSENTIEELRSFYASMISQGLVSS